MGACHAQRGADGPLPRRIDGSRAALGVRPRRRGS
jgi:hypothetical protein